MPFRQFVVKTHARCNLACRYCYLYSGPDRGWRARPPTASAAVREQTARRIGEHAARHRLRRLSLVLHGGEPLLHGAGPLVAYTEAVRRAVPAGSTVHATVQTNGTLLTDESAALLSEHRITVGLSIDGGLPHHNRLRVDHAGRPSHAAVVRAARLLADRHRTAYAGLLVVVDPTLDPAEVHRSLLELDPPALDLLLPHGNWTTPPPGARVADGSGATPYGDWLCAVFDLWWRAPRHRTRIRLFEQCLALLLGRPAAGESLGTAPFTAVVVETDGTLEQVDSLKSAYDGAAATGLDVFRHTFDEALDHPGIAARQAGAAALAAECRACPVVRVCGGGNYAHRYRAETGFVNPSVYCADLMRLIRHVAAALAAEAAAAGPAAPRTTGGGPR
ncbi:FxsB family cyclophane-forming radical SAM/SPASM peptide maturase [Streptomyces abyssomicinicus]|uniref:FxsB family cyclophane-forming radical SAM/SPASM peptide maturase n=1 Tax=Streptomyces abyssomicinicus TaxID=574929 RepID=UPI00124FBDBA|nr:FxsB family cyclophane-forming radical SAM/SPASM peptide maturase [Streptomyces abyssomicinicus]